MSNHNDGGSAFPHDHQYWVTDDGDHHHRGPQPGMSLWDYFAGQALVALVSSPHFDRSLSDEELASLCYGAGAAFLAERAKRMEGTQ